MLFQLGISVGKLLRIKEMEEFARSMASLMLEFEQYWYSSNTGAKKVILYTASAIHNYISSIQSSASRLLAQDLPNDKQKQV